MSFFEIIPPEFFPNNQDTLMKNIDQFVDFMGEPHFHVKQEKSSNEYFNTIKYGNPIVFKVTTPNYIFMVTPNVVKPTLIGKVFFTPVIFDLEYLKELDVFYKTSDEIKNQCSHWVNFINEQNDIVQNSVDNVVTGQTNTNDSISQALDELSLTEFVKSMTPINKTKYVVKLNEIWCDEIVFKLSKNTSRIKSIKITPNQRSKETIVINKPSFANTKAIFVAIKAAAKDESGTSEQEEELVAELVAGDYANYSKILQQLNLLELANDPVQFELATDAYKFDPGVPVSKKISKFLIKQNGVNKEAFIDFHTIVNKKQSRLIVTSFYINNVLGIKHFGDVDATIKMFKETMNRFGCSPINKL